MNLGARALAAGVALLLAGCHGHTAATPAATLGSVARCKAYSGLPPGWGKLRHAGMARIAGGDFEFGSLRGYAEERPPQKTHIASFWIDRTEVTNAQFASFVAATGYVTEAEHGAGSAVFVMPKTAAEIAPGNWWHLIKGADWRHPEGPGSNIAGRGHEPVVDVTYADAQAYAHWLGRSLPSEAQWEYAAKAGRDDADSDRSLRDASGKPQANFWQGLFPLQNTDEDGFAGRAPVGCYAANPDGLQDMVGNVWEWTTDLYADHHDAALADSADHRLTDLPPRAGVARRVIKGGSYLCSDNYCVRARAASRQPEEVDLPATHLGFRTML
ncbi:MAG: formylglycine-generating enzyme family protein, partial [Stenotrophobium sp.]